MKIFKKEEPKITKPVGFSGPVHNSEIEDPEYLADLSEENAYTVYNEMRCSDVTVEMTLEAVKLPIKRAVVRVQPASEDKKDIEIAEFIQRAILKPKEKDWPTTLDDILTFLEFGHSVLEKEFVNAPEGTVLSKLGFRKQNTIDKWNTDAKGSFTGITQRIHINENEKQVFIPVENLLIFTRKKEGNNWRGRSILRPAYGNWYSKLRYRNMALESGSKSARGIVSIKLQPGATKEDEANAGRLIQAYAANTLQGFVLPDGADLQILWPSSGRPDFNPDIELNNQEIARNVMAGFLLLGTSKTGSWALADVLQKNFIRAIQAIAEVIQEVLNRYLVPQLVGLNFPRVREYPEFLFEKISDADLVKWAGVMTQMYSAGIIQKEIQDEEYVRDVLGLPDFDPEARETEKKSEPPKPKEPEDQDPEDEESEDETPAETEESEEGCATCGQRNKGAWLKSHPLEERMKNLTEPEKAVDWNGLQKKHDSLGDQAKKIILSIEKTMKKQILENAASLTPKKLDKLKLSDPSSEGRLRKLAEKAYNESRGQVYKETKNSELLKAKAPSLMKVMDEILPLVTFKIANRLKTNAAGTLGDSSWESLPAEKREAIMKARLDKLSDNVIGQEAPFLIGSAIALGRDNAAQELLKEGRIKEKAVGSSILDENLCDECRENINGREFEIGSSEYYENLPPYSGCEGGSRCRCAFIYVGN